MLRLNIEQQPAKLALAITNASLTMRTQRPRLEMETKAAVVEIRQPRGRLEIDQYPCRAAYGLKTLTDRTRDMVKAAHRAALEAIAKTAADGDRMAHIEKEKNVIAKLAAEASVAEQLEVGLVPIPPPEIRYHIRPPEYQVTPASVNIRYYPGKLNEQYNRGAVNVSLAQYQSIRMWTTGTLDFSG